MNRRTFLAGTGAVLLAAPLAAEGQQAKKVWRIGFLSASSAPANLLTAAAPFRQGLHDLGYVEGRDFVMEYRYAEGQPDRLPRLAAALVRASVDVIVTIGTLSCRVRGDSLRRVRVGVVDRVASGFQELATFMGLWPRVLY